MPWFLRTSEQKRKDADSRGTEAAIPPGRPARRRGAVPQHLLLPFEAPLETGQIRGGARADQGRLREEQGAVRLSPRPCRPAPVGPHAQPQDNPEADGRDGAAGQAEAQQVQVLPRDGRRGRAQCA